MVDVGGDDLVLHRVFAFGVQGGVGGQVRRGRFRGLLRLDCRVLRGDGVVLGGFGCGCALRCGVGLRFCVCRLRRTCIVDRLDRGGLGRVYILRRCASGVVHGLDLCAARGVDRLNRRAARGVDRLNRAVLGVRDLLLSAFDQLLRLLFRGLCRVLRLDCRVLRGDGVVLGGSGCGCGCSGLGRLARCLPGVVQGVVLVVRGFLLHCRSVLGADGVALCLKRLRLRVFRALLRILDAGVERRDQLVDDALLHIVRRIVCRL